MLSSNTERADETLFVRSYEPCARDAEGPLLSTSIWDITPSGETLCLDQQLDLTPGSRKTQLILPILLLHSSTSWIDSAT